jgi:hypothetical protein
MSFEVVNSPDSYWQTFPNFGFTRTKFSDAELAPIKAEIMEIQNDFSSATPHAYSLVGQIKHEYTLTKTQDYINKLMTPLIETYERQFRIIELNQYCNNPFKLSLESVWVNFQQKHEYNPIHSHSGVLSFVMWITIPYDMDSERNAMPSTSSNFDSAGMFSFHYQNTLGKISTYPMTIDKSMENQCLVFPSSFLHSVQPFFSSDGYRISVAGNLGYENI